MVLPKIDGIICQAYVLPLVLCTAKQHCLQVHFNGCRLYKVVKAGNNPGQMYCDPLGLLSARTNRHDCNHETEKQSYPVSLPER